MKIVTAFILLLLVLLILLTGCHSQAQIDATRTENWRYRQYKQILIGMNPTEVGEILGPHTLTKSTTRLWSLRTTDKNKAAGLHVFFVDGVVCQKVFLRYGAKSSSEGLVSNVLHPGSAEPVGDSGPGVMFAIPLAPR
jgi:hypothetical protein